MISVCTRNFFVFEGRLVPSGEFSAYFTTSAKYIYEVLRVQHGIPLFIEDHLDRLWKTAFLEKVNLPFTKNDILADIFLLIHNNPLEEGNIKIFISLPASSPITRLVYYTPHQYPTLQQYSEGVPVSLFDAERTNPNAKVMDVSLRAATEVAKQKNEVYEVLLVDRNGNITEGSRSNVFFIRKNMLITPPVHAVLEGVTRKQVMYLCEQNKIPVSEQDVNVNALSEMESVFITGTSRRVLPVSNIGQLYFNVSHSLIKTLQSLLDEHVNEYLRTHQFTPK